MTRSEHARRPRRLTLEQIGERAGVSRSTVSRVLNDHPDVRPEVRARVEAVVRETGYRPNPAARALVSNRSGMIGLVVLTEVDELFGDPYYSALVSGIQKGCLEHGLLFLIFPVESPRESPEVLVPQMTTGLVDGVIVTSGPRSERLIAALRDLGTRMVVIGHPTDDAGLRRVDVENRVGSTTAVAHLLEHGRRRIGFVGANDAYRFGVERLAGYSDALRVAGVQFDERLVRVDEPTRDGGYAATELLLSEEVDAIYASTDPMAAGAYRALRERGLRIPDDIAIVGFDGLPRGPELEPTLTTVVQPVVEVGRVAVELLAEGDDTPRVEILATMLRRGASCGAEGGAPSEPADFSHPPQPTSKEIE